MNLTMSQIYYRAFLHTINLIQKEEKLLKKTISEGNKYTSKELIKKLKKDAEKLEKYFKEEKEKEE